MTLDQFLVTYTVRAPQLMWLLGAGSSAAAGIPTASDLIWKFKQTLFCASQRLSVKSVEDLSSPTIRQRLKRHFERLGNFPPEDTPEEYAAYFEAAYPDPRDRRTVIDRYVRDGSPSYGHMALAVLFALDRARIVWTTNFDRLLEDAAIGVLGSSSRLVVASLDNALVAREALTSERWPLVCKLHGDFQSSRLKNTAEELRTQDAELRRSLVDSCKRLGLVAMGYSGRDESVMHALREAIDGGNGFPRGLFWFHRPGEPVLPAVTTLIREAEKAGIQAALVEAETFDEVLGDLVKQVETVPPDLAAKLDNHRSRISEVPLPDSCGGWPVIRLNALPVPRYPTLCRLVACAIGNTKAVKEALAASGVHAVAVRQKQGVLAFGADADLRKAFGPFGIATFDMHSIEPRRLHYESSELGLLRDAFAVALAKHRPVTIRRRRDSDLCLLDPLRPSLDIEPLKRVAGQLRGVVPNTSVTWEEALYIKLSYHLSRMWLLIEPSVRLDLDDTASDDTKETAKDFARERLATRYNNTWNAFLDAWAVVVVGKDQDVILRAFEDDGPDATYSVHRTTGFSRRGQSS